MRGRVWIAGLVTAGCSLLAGTVAKTQLAPLVFAWEAEIRGTREHALRWPVAVAAGSSEEIVVADAFAARLLVVAYKPVEGWTVSSTIELPATPLDLVHDGERYLVSMRRGEGLVALEGSKFQQRKIPLPEGTVAGALAAHPDGGFWLWDSAGGRVLSFDATGRTRLEVAVEGYVTALEGAADGGFYAAATQPGEVLRYAPTGELRGRWPLAAAEPVPAWPAGLAVEAGGELVVADRHGSRLLVLDRNGRLSGLGSRRGWEAGLLLRPRGISLMPDGRLIVADAGNGRVQLFQRTDRDSER